MRTQTHLARADLARADLARAHLARAVALLLLAALLLAVAGIPVARAAPTGQTPAPGTRTATDAASADAAPAAALPAEEAARAWLVALAAQDGNAILKYTCLAERQRIQDAVTSSGHLMGVAASTGQVEHDVSDMGVETLAATARTARLAVSGEIRFAVGARAQAYPLDDVWEFVREANTWRWCGSASGALPLALEDAPAAAMPGPLLDTPEAAIDQYLAGVRNRDIEQLLAASAAQEMAAGFDFVAFAERLQSIQPLGGLAPASDPFLVRINRAQVETNLLRQTRSLVYSLLVPQFNLERPTFGDDFAPLANEIAAMDLVRLATIELRQTYLPLPEAMESERGRTNALRAAAVYGADDQTERVAVITFEGNAYLVGFQLVRYGDTWKVSAQHSIYEGMDALGRPIPLGPADAVEIPDEE